MLLPIAIADRSPAAGQHHCLRPYKQVTPPAPPKAAQWTQKREVTHCIAFLRHPGNMAGAACEVHAMHAKLPCTDIDFQQAMALQRANPDRRFQHFDLPGAYRAACFR